MAEDLGARAARRGSSACVPLGKTLHEMLNPLLLMLADWALMAVVMVALWLWQRRTLEADGVHPRGAGELESLAAEYERGFSEALRELPSRGRHTNVLQHLAGYVSDDIDRGDRTELAESIEGYRSGLVPLIVPVVLIRHYVRRLGVEYLADQVYLDPHPYELMLLNHV